MKRLLKIVFFSLTFTFLFSKNTAFAIIEHNAYKCSRGNYHECTTGGGCWGECGSSPMHQGEISVCPTGYRCFCENDDYNDGDDTLFECGCVECTEGCEDPFGYFTHRDACPTPTCEVNGFACLPWDSGCARFNSMSFSCVWHDEACCVDFGDNMSCSKGLCSFPGKMLPLPDNFDGDDESTWCPEGYSYGGFGTNYSRVCTKTEGDEIIGGLACCLSNIPCPGKCSAKCPPTDRPDLDGISLDYTCSDGLLCCVENVVKISCHASCVKATSSGGCPVGYNSLGVGDFDCSAFGEDYVCCEKNKNYKPRDAAYNGPVIDSLEKILGPVVKILYYGGLMLGIFYIIISGYKLIVSQGNPQQTQDAQEQLTAAILGIIFILLSVTILRVILGKVMGITM